MTKFKSTKQRKFVMSLLTHPVYKVQFNNKHYMLVRHRAGFHKGATLYVPLTHFRTIKSVKRINHPSVLQELDAVGELR
jgi:Fe2+ or Zn2+ uptake regulation protein